MTIFQETLKEKMNEYVHIVYRVTKKFPKDELYGIISQIRRSSLSIILNYVEGYARQRLAVQLNFLETAYGSLQESRYLLIFSEQEYFLEPEDCDKALKLADEIGAMLWTEIVAVKKSRNPKNSHHS